MTSFFAAGGSAVVPTPLTPGTYFWFVEGRAQGAPTGERSATWHFRVGPRDTAVDTEQPNGADFNNDGYSDLLLQDWRSTPRRFRVLPGSSTGPSADRVWSFVGAIEDILDLDGDGCSDLVLQDEVWFGGTDSFFTRRTRHAALEGRVVLPMGDVDLDGYEDMYTLVYQHPAYNIVATLQRGGPEGLTATATTLPRLPDSFSEILNFTPLPDLNGDRRRELGLTSSLFGGIHRAWTVSGADGHGYLSGASGERLVGMSSAGDVNGDGYGDFYSWHMNENEIGPPGRVFSVSPARVPSSFMSFPDGTAWVVSYGDINGDGCSEMVFGNESGAARTLRWAPCGGPARPDLVLSPPSGNLSLWPAGDLNGDGFADVGVSSSTGTSLRLGSAEGLTTTEIPLSR